MTQLVSLSESAAFHVQKMRTHNEEEGSYLRVAIHGGGCSGLTYGLGFEKEMLEGDQLLEQHGIQMILATADIDILKGTEIDYKESLMGGGFTINNPNAILSCGCGTSFRTADVKGKPSESC